MGNRETEKGTQSPKVPLHGDVLRQKAEATGMALTNLVAVWEAIISSHSP